MRAIGMIGIGALVELLSRSEAALSYYEDLVGMRLADGSHHDLVLDIANERLERYAWKRVPPELAKGRILLSRVSPGDALAVGRLDEFIERLTRTYERERALVNELEGGLER